MSENRCETCRHWHNPWGEPSEDGDLDWRAPTTEVETGDPFGLGMRHDVCLTCRALVAEPFVPLHGDFHDLHGHARVTWQQVAAAMEANEDRP